MDIAAREFNKSDYQFFTIVADIGASNAHFAVMGIREKKKFDILLKDTLITSDIREVHTVLNRMLREAHERYRIEVNRCCIGAAGPVPRKRDYIKLTNVDLQIVASTILQNSLLNKVILINDFEAIGYGLDLLDLQRDVVKLEHVGQNLLSSWTSSNTFAVLGAGSGLGMSIAPYNSARHTHEPLPSEGGHIDFCPYDHMELDLADYLRQKAVEKRDVHPELERVLSGKGLELIYGYVRSKGYYRDTDVSRHIDRLAGNHKLQEIFENSNSDEACWKTVDLFIKFYARAARTLGLMTQCYGGLFIAGKMVSHISKFQDGRFMQEFEKHDKRSDVLRKIPVYIVTSKDVGLLGCCNVAANFYNIA